MALRRAAFAGAAIGSRAPEAISTALPASPPVAPGDCSGIIARKHLRPKQQHGSGDVGAVGITKRHGGRQSVVLACRLDEVGELVRTGAHVVLVEHAFREPAEEARHAVLKHLAARGQERRAERNHLAERKEVGFVTAGSVQDQEGTRRGLRPRLETVDEREASHHAALSTPASSGSAASISARRTSRNGGSLRSRPSVATGSSTAKPGWSVAISNRMPPGSRK